MPVCSEHQDRIGFVLGAYLAVSLIVLAAFKWQWLTFSQSAFLLFVNVNMAFLSLVAALFSLTAWRRSRERIWALLTVAMGLDFLGEIALYLQELYGSDSENPLGPAEIPILLMQIVLIALCVHALRTREKDATGGSARAVVPWLIFGGLVAFFSFGALRPIWLDPVLREEAFFGTLLLGGVDLLVLACIVAVVSTGRMGWPQRDNSLFWPLVGMSIYFLADLLYYYYFAQRDPSFCLWEAGYFAGYLSVAFGSLFVTRKP